MTEANAPDERVWDASVRPQILKNNQPSAVRLILTADG
jgi:hypothetical protein